MPSFEDRKQERKSSADKIVTKLIGIILAVFVINAGFTLAIVLYFQGQYNASQELAHKQGAQVGHSICLTLGKLAALQPPAGNPSTNPSRAFDQKLHQTLDELGPDLECNG
jgi:hypothetical protein